MKWDEDDIYRKLLDEATAQITIIDADTYRILYANQSALDKTKDMPGTYIGSVCYEFITHGTKPCPHCIIKTAEPGEYKSRIVDFASRTYKQLYKIVDWNGRRAMMEYTEDITEQAQNIAYAKQEKELMSLILSRIPVGIVVYKYEDEKVTLLDINSTMREFLHLGEKSVTDADFDSILSYSYEEDREVVPQGWESIEITRKKRIF